MNGSKCSAEGFLHTAKLLTSVGLYQVSRKGLTKISRGNSYPSSIHAQQGMVVQETGDLRVLCGKAPLFKSGALIATVASGGAGFTMAALLSGVEYVLGWPANSCRHQQIALKTELMTSFVWVLNAVLSAPSTSWKVFSPFYPFRLRYILLFIILVIELY